MYRIYIPQVKSIDAALQSVDWMHRYTDMIMGHVTTPVTFLDIPYPIYVLRSIAYAEKSAFTGIHDIVEILKDVAFIACTAVTSTGRSCVMNKNSSCTFTSTEMKDIYSMIAELNKRASAHKDILPQLRALQQQCRDKYNQLTKRKILLRAQDKKMAMLTKDQVSNDDTMRRWLNYKMKIERSTYAHNIATNNFRDMLYKERRLRLDMDELKHELHQLLCEKIERRFQETLEKMATTIDLVDLNRSNARYQSVKSYIQTIDVREMAENMLRNGSVEYEYPNIQEIIEATGFLEPLPKGRMTSWRLQEHKMADNDFITPSLQSVDDEMEPGLDRNTNNGRYLRTVGSKHLPGPEFLKLKKDQTFKQKLTVMGGEVAFGWSRKGQFGQKKWGFCDTRLVLGVV